MGDNEKKTDENEGKTNFSTEGLPFLIDLLEPETIIGIKAVRLENKGIEEQVTELFNDGYYPEKTLVLLGMSTEFAQTNFHKIVTIFVKRQKK